MAINTYPSSLSSNLPLNASSVVFDGQLVNASFATRTTTINVGNYYAYFGQPGIVVFSDGATTNVSTPLVIQSLNVASTKTSITVYGSPFTMTNTALLPSTATWSKSYFLNGKFYALRNVIGTNATTAGFGQIGVSTDGLTWTSGTFPTFTQSSAQTLFAASAAYGNNKFTLNGLHNSGSRSWALNVSTGSFTLIDNRGPWFLTSTDGAAWNYVGLSTLISATGGAATASRRFAVNNTGTGYTSTDGILWTSASLPVDPSGRYNSFRLVKLNNTYWGSNPSATDNAPTVVPYSTDLVTWSARTIPTTGAYVFAYGASTYVALGRQWPNAPTVQTSTDGITWTTRTTLQNSMSSASAYSLTFEGNNFVAYGSWVSSDGPPDFNTTYFNSAYYSTNGITWTLTTTGTGGVAGANTAGSMGVVAGSGIHLRGSSAAGTTYLTSTNGVIWTTRTTGAAMTSTNTTWSSFDTLLHNGTRFLVTGRERTTYIHSTDGITWSSGSLPTAPYGMWVSDTGFFGAGLGTTISSTDGITWTTVAGVSPTKSQNGISGVDVNSNMVTVYAQSKFVNLAGWGGSSSFSTTSTDGIVWAAGGALAHSSVPYSLAFGNNVWVAPHYGQNVASTSTDGVTWTSRNLPSASNWTSIAFGSSRFVAIASGTNISAWSTDGITWTTTVLPAITSWKAITYHTTYFVAASESTSGASSTDGVTWVPFTATSGMDDVVSNGSTRIVGTPTGASQQLALYSTPLSTSFGIYTGPTTIY